MNLFNVIKHNPIVLPLACAAVLGMTFISEESYWQSIKALDKLGEIGVVRTSIHDLQKYILDAETGQRGYLLTNRADYIQPFQRALPKVDVTLAQIDAYYRNKPEYAASVARLQELTRAKLSELSETLRLYEQGKPGNAIDMMLSDIGREKMDALRGLSNELLDQESRSAFEGRKGIYNTLMLRRLGIAALGGISLLALFMYLRQTLVLRQQQQAQQVLVQAERDRLELDVIQRTKQLTELAHHLQTAREDERQRLARNLHDELGALLTSAKLDAARIRSRLSVTSPEALERLNHLVETLNSSIALGRRIIEDLRPSTLSNLGLMATLEILAREFAEPAHVQVHCDFEPVQLSPQAELVAYRVVQEAITNMSKYARAKNLWLCLREQGQMVEVSVRDDGVGFNTAVQPASTYGLLGMRFRVEAVGGTLQVRSALGQGTHIQARLPRKAVI